MSALHLIHAALDPADPDYPPIPSGIEEGICCITGASGPSLLRRELLGPSWTQHDHLKRPDSPRVGVAAYVALRYKWERMSSWICDGATFRRLDRQGVRAAVLGPLPERPWAGYATTSYKKHGGLLAPVNGPGQRRWLWEGEVADCSDAERVEELWLRLNAALCAGIGRSVIESLECPPWLIGRVGLSVWMDFEGWARPRYRSGLYRFLSYLLPSQEELRQCAA